MREYTIRCSRDDGSRLIFISSLADEDDALDNARSIMKLFAYPRAEVWDGHRLVRNVVARKATRGIK